MRKEEGTRESDRVDESQRTMTCEKERIIMYHSNLNRFISMHKAHFNLCTGKMFC